VRLRKFRIFGASGNTDAGLGVAHGVYAHRAAERPLDVFGVVLEEVYIGRIAGRGIYATSGVTLGGRFTRVLNTRGQCLNLNSTNDAQWFGCGFGGGSVQTAVLSGNGQLSFTACNFYASPEDNIYLYEAADAGGSRQTMFYACSIDRARQHGMRYDVQNPRSVVMLIASYFSLNGLLTPNTYSDIYVTAAAASESLIIEGGSQFQLTHADNPAINVKHNIEFATGSTNLVRTNGAKFEGGAGRASISNRKGQLFTENLGLRTFGDGRMSLPSDFPTSAAGLPAGFLYRDGNILRVA